MNPSSKDFAKILAADQLIAIERLRARFEQLPESRMPGRIIHRPATRVPGHDPERLVWRARRQAPPLSDPFNDVLELQLDSSHASGISRVLEWTQEVPK
jgi:hypothetical protein